MGNMVIPFQLILHTPQLLIAGIGRLLLFLQPFELIPAGKGQIIGTDG